MTKFAEAQQRVLARKAAKEHAASASAVQLAHARLQKVEAYPARARSLAVKFCGLPAFLSAIAKTQPAFRVGQLDSEVLDDELGQLLYDQVGEGLRNWGYHLKDDWEAEIRVILQGILWKLSMWDHATSYGASLQGLHYVDARLTNEGRHEDVSHLQRAAHGVIAIIGRYVWHKWEHHLNDTVGTHGESTSAVSQLRRVTNLLSISYRTITLASFVAFLHNGKYRSLTDRILRLRLVSASNQTSREVSFEYLNRQLVWHAFTEFLLFLLPLLGIHRWRKWLSRALNRCINLFSHIWTNDNGDSCISRVAGELGHLPETTCAICYRKSHQYDDAANSPTGSADHTDIVNPYQSLDCSCVYCFVCLAQQIEGEAGEGWTCLRCGANIKGCTPWHGDLVSAVSASHPKISRTIVWAEDLCDARSERSRSSLSDLDPIPIDDDLSRDGDRSV